MIKRTKGRLLLTLLVITGLAGTINNDSLSYKEKKIAVNLMKDSRADVLKSLKGLSEAQLNFKTAPDQWSIKECVYHVAVSEKSLWDQLGKTMKAPANPEKRAEIKITDEQLIRMMDNCNKPEKTQEILSTKKNPYKSLNEALNVFKTKRAEHIKYIKSTTEDLRNHVIQTSLGWMDCYQLCLMMTLQSNHYFQQIEEVKRDPNFPKH